MSHERRWVAVGVVVSTLCILLGQSVRAENPERLAAALEIAGLDLRGNHNPLSGGIDFLASNEYDGTPLNFGAWNVGLTGPVSLDVSTGGRLLSQFNVSFTTALNGNSEATPLNYAFNFDTGPQTMQVNGSVLADVDFSLNRLGYYDLKVDYSGRQTRTTDGVQTGTNDLDVGPINISGNLYADALAILTDPLFDRAGRENFFVKLSGNDALETMLSGSTNAPDEPASSAAKSIAEIAARVIARGLANAGENGNSQFGLSNAQSHGGAVPEPAVLVLMLLGIPAILLHPRRMR